MYSPSRQHSQVLDGSHNVVNWRNPFPVARASGRREDGLLRDNGKAGFLMAACGEEEEGWGHPQCVHPPIPVTRVSNGKGGRADLIL